MAIRLGDKTEALEEAIPPPSAASPCLFLALQCHAPSAGSARYDLSAVHSVLLGRGGGPERTVERDSASQCLQLRVPDGAMSAQHASLLRGAAGWQLVDHGSTNGTRVNGQRVSSAALQDGDLLECGGTFLILRTRVTGANDVGDADTARFTPEEQAFTTLIPAHAQALERLDAINATDVSVLLRGESGTGKERLAAAVHQRSGRSGALVPVNCGALTQTLVESQLFGHVRGAFSGAIRDEIGFIRAADGGTLFLDEIGDMPLPAQAALLRVLQEREVTPVGSTRREKVDFRVIAATHRDLNAPGAEFRPDLYARLAGFTHTLPCLRQRREDMGTLIATILRELAPERAHTTTMKVDVGRALLQYAWPLNIRELFQALKVARIVARGAPLDLTHFPDAISGFQAAPSAAAPAATPTPRSEPVRSQSMPEPDLIRKSLLAALEAHGGNVSEVARELGKTRMQIHRWLRRFEIDVGSFRR